MNWAACGALLLMLGVCAGAFGAHLLKPRLAPDALGWWLTAVDYHMWTSLGLFAVGLSGENRRRQPWMRRGATLLFLGLLIFCGSLYVMALTGLRWLGAVTPIGGLGLIFGWFALALAFVRTGRSDRHSA